MPAKSEKQFKFMQMIAHGVGKKKMGGPSKKVADEFIKKTPKGLFGGKRKSS